ncbi:GntR family transcriptional regulator [Rhodobacteraceae bacterium KMM 6894]|nr:GntR family transcriptional regulator [Rhodobacteraceae bacterium KMM 6894]
MKNQLDGTNSAFEVAEGPLRRGTLQQQVYDRLRLRLISGAYRPGEALSSRGLAGELGVSAMPVREALTRLTAEGALELTSGRTLQLPLLSPEDFDEITAIRLDLEGRAASRAAVEVTPEGVEAVRQAHAVLCKAAEAKDIDAYLVANASFHSCISAAAGWPRLLDMIHRLWMIVGPSIRACLTDSSHLATSMRFHDAALAAIEARDEVALRAAIVDDIQAAATNIRAFLAAGNAEPSTGRK